MISPLQTLIKEADLVQSCVQSAWSHKTVQSTYYPDHAFVL